MKIETTEKSELITVEQKHDYLRELAKRQGVEPIEKINDLYAKSADEDFDVDEFLEYVQEMRRNGDPVCKLENLTDGK